MVTTRLLILGVVRQCQPVHGYDVRRELQRWYASGVLGKRGPGSVYHALRSLAGEGLLREVGTERVGTRPARTWYEITERGREEFRDLLLRSVWEYREPSHPFGAAYLFLPALTPREAAAGLRNRARMLRLRAEGADARREAPDAMPEHVRDLLLLAAAQARVEADWCERVAGRAAAGELADPVSGL